MRRRIFQIGDPVPYFIGRSNANPQFHFSSVAGHYTVMCFLGSSSIESSANALKLFTNDIQQLFNNPDFAFFGISVDPTDEKKLQQQAGIHYFWDFDGEISRQYGAIDFDEGLKTDKEDVKYFPFTLILDPMLRVIGQFSMDDKGEHNKLVADFLEKLPQSTIYKEATSHAPVLIVPRIFEPEFCRNLIDIYEKFGGTPSGFMKEEQGYTVHKSDPTVKRRQDYNLKDDPAHDELRTQINTTLHRRLIPEIFKAFQFNAKYIERYLIACYDAEPGGFFMPHRDNTTKGTAHRRFAVTINLNADDYEGGDLCFPEFGQQTYHAPTGGAVVFSCSLLHEAKPVTSGKRYAFLPFLYDETARIIRDENRKFIGSPENNEQE